MRIDNDCVRDLLFVIEENATIEYGCYMSGAKKRYPQISSYDGDKIAYHLRYLKMKGLIFNPDEQDVFSYDLSPSGHEFLANVRDDNNWKKIKSISASIGFASLKIISAIAEGVATAGLNQSLGFTK